MHELILNNDIHIYIEENSSIFSSAYKAGVFFEHSCLNGQCGNCKALLKKGNTLAENGESGLSKEEKADGYILTCVRTPQSDIELEVENISETMLEVPRTLPAKVENILYLKDDILELKLRLPPNANFKFLPGQHVTLIRNSIKRKYSIAGINSTGHLIFFIKKYTNGKFSHYFFNEIKNNDLIYLEGPLGSFYYRANKIDHTIFLATGTGIAPIKAILDELNATPSNLKCKDIHLFVGVREKKDIFLEFDYKNIILKIYPCLSQSSEDGCFNGYVQDVLLSSDINISMSEVYACGSIQMIHDAKEKLINSGLNKKYFYSDAFVSSND